MDAVDQARSAVGPGPVETAPLTGVAGVPDAIKIQILATEHWSLLATRSLVWNEMFTRAGMFLTVVSSVVVALSLLSQATDFNDEFRVLSILMLPVMLLVGIGTFLRLIAANNEDVGLVIGMNRLRHAYLEIAPDLEPYFITGVHDDHAGIVRTYGLNAHRPPQRVLSSTILLVGVVDAVVAGAFVALLLQQLFDWTDPVVVSAGVIVTIATGALLFLLAMREIHRSHAENTSVFPAP